MKILLFLILLGYGNLISSQNYLELNPEWNEYSISCGGGNPYCSSFDLTIRLDGDTIIGGFVYFRTRRDGIYKVWNWTNDTLVSEEEIHDFNSPPLRENQGRFYIYNTFLKTDQLLHNFNLSVGDTAVSSIDCKKYQIVLKIDTVYFGTQMRKKFSFALQNSRGDSPLYEGIGTSRGLFVMPCNGTVLIEGGSRLRCYTQNKETLKIDSLAPCVTANPLGVVNNILDEYKIYPNPFNENLIIDCSFIESKIENIKIYDFYGNLIKLNSVLSYSNRIEISTSEFVSGVYVLTLSTKNKFYVWKVIKH